MIFLDLETTGLLRPVAADLMLQPYIIEICAIRLDSDYDLVGEVKTFVNPPVPVPEEVTKITGIDDSHLVGAPSFLGVYDSLCELFLGEDTLVAHNASFDVGVLRWELTRHDFELKFPWPKNHICTVEKSYSIENRRLKLTELYQLATGKSHDENAHRAEEDVIALIKSYRWLEKEGYI